MLAALPTPWKRNTLARLIRSSLLTNVDLPFPDIKLRIEATTDASDEKLEVLKRDLPRYCPIAKMIEGAGTKVETEWVINRP